MIQEISADARHLLFQRGPASGVRRMDLERVTLNFRHTAKKCCHAVMRRGEVKFYLGPLALVRLGGRLWRKLGQRTEAVERLDKARLTAAVWPNDEVERPQRHRRRTQS